MANFFYDNNGASSNTAPYDTWAKAATSLATVAGAMAAGDTLYVGNDSAESVAGTITATFPGTSASPNVILCVTPSGTTGNSGVAIGSAGAGSVATTGANNFTLAGSFYCYGVFFSSGANLNCANATGNFQKFEQCTHKTTASSAVIFLSAGAANSWFINNTFTISSTSAVLDIRGSVLVQGGSLTGTAPTGGLFANVSGIGLFEGFDFSNLGNHTLYSNQTAGFSRITMKDCKAPASYTRTATQTISGQGELYVLRSDSSATNYISEKYNYWGSQVVNTSITRSGGASDGTTPISWTVTPLNTSWPEPFLCIPIAIWNTVVGTVNVTIHATSNLAAGAFPNNDDIWINVEGLGTSGNPQGIYANNTKANYLASNSAYTNDSTTWNNAPAGGTFAMTATIVTTQVGWIYVYVNAAKTSTIFYVDPLAVLS